MKSSGRSSHLGCLTPMTAAMATAGCATAAFSRSMELIHSPPDLITSLVRSRICITPCGLMVAMSPVGNQPSTSAERSALWYRSTIHWPRTISSPCATPSRGRRAPFSSTSLSSMPNTDLPCLATSAWRSSGGSSASAAPSTLMAAIAVVSVMPQPWRTSTSYTSLNLAISALGMAEPPTPVRRMVLKRSPCCSTCWIRPIQIVGTPALTVTRSVSISSYRLAASRRGPGSTSLAPPISAA